MISSKFFNTYMVYIYSLVFIFILILINYIYYFATKFSKIITIENKYTYAKNRSTRAQTVSDTNDVVYTVDDSLILFHWTSAEVFNKIDIGKTYKIEGYGKRIPFLGFFPVIISAKLMP